MRRNAFLADINNERASKNALYRENLASLQRLVLLRFSEDFTVVPRDSAWFAFYDGKKLQGMRDTALYQARAAAGMTLCFLGNSQSTMPVSFPAYLWVPSLKLPSPAQPKGLPC